MNMIKITIPELETELNVRSVHVVLTDEFSDYVVNKKEILRLLDTERTQALQLDDVLIELGKWLDNVDLQVSIFCNVTGSDYHSKELADYFDSRFKTIVTNQYVTSYSYGMGSVCLINVLGCSIRDDGIPNNVIASIDRNIKLSRNVNRVVTESLWVPNVCMDALKDHYRNIGYNVDIIQADSGMRPLKHLVRIYKHDLKPDDGYLFIDNYFNKHFLKITPQEYYDLLVELFSNNFIFYNEQHPELCGKFILFCAEFYDANKIEEYYNKDFDFNEKWHQVIVLMGQNYIDDFGIWNVPLSGNYNIELHVEDMDRIDGSIGGTLSIRGIRAGEDITAYMHVSPARHYFK